MIKNVALKKHEKQSRHSVFFLMFWKPRAKYLNILYPSRRDIPRQRPRVPPMLDITPRTSYLNLLEKKNIKTFENLENLASP